MGHFIVPLEEHTNLELFHGTTPDRLESIRDNGLIPPASLMDKSHGFITEGSLRYTGRDLEPAKNHSSNNCIIKLNYSGLIAVTSLTCVAEELNLLLDNLPKKIGGVQYHEYGRSIAFRPEAELSIIQMPAITPMPLRLKKECSWFTKLWRLVCKAF